MIPLLLLAGLGVVLVVKQMGSSSNSGTTGSRRPPTAFEEHMDRLRGRIPSAVPITPTAFQQRTNRLRGRIPGAATQAVMTSSDIDSKLQQIDEKAREAYNKLTAQGRKEGADALNKELGTNLTGDESWDEVKDKISGPIGAIAGGAVGGAVGGPAGAVIGAAVGSYLGVKLGDLLSKGYGEIADFFDNRWSDIKEEVTSWVSGYTHEIIGAEEQFANKCDFCLKDGVLYACCYLRDANGMVYKLERSVDLTPAIDLVVRRLAAWHAQQHGHDSALENLPAFQEQATSAAQRVAQNKTVHSLMEQATAMARQAPAPRRRGGVYQQGLAVPPGLARELIPDYRHQHQTTTHNLPTPEYGDEMVIPPEVYDDFYDGGSNDGPYLEADYID